MVGVDAVAEDAKAEVDAALDPGAGKEDASGGVDSVQEAEVGRVVGGEAEGDDGELGRPGELQGRVGRKGAVGGGGQVQLLVQGGAEGGDAVEMEWQPEAQPPEVAGQLRSEIGIVGEALVVGQRGTRPDVKLSSDQPSCTSVRSMAVCR